MYLTKILGDLDFIRLPEFIIQITFDIIRLGFKESTETYLLELTPYK